MNELITITLILLMIYVVFRLIETVYKIILHNIKSNSQSINSNKEEYRKISEIDNYFDSERFKDTIYDIDELIYTSRIKYIEDFREYLNKIDSDNELDIDINESVPVTFNTSASIFSETIDVLSIDHFAKSMIDSCYSYIVLSDYSNLYYNIYHIDDVDYDRSTSIIKLTLNNSVIINLNLNENNISFENDVNNEFNDIYLTIPICISDKYTFNIIPYTLIGPIINEYFTLIFADYMLYYQNYISIIKNMDYNKTHFISGKEIIFEKLHSLLERYNIGLDEDALGSILISFYLLKLINK